MKRTSPRDGWSFTYRSKSEVVTLPHSWENLDGQNGGSDYFTGLGTYEHKFAPQLMGDKRLYLEFEAAHAAVEIFVNGVSIATHKSSDPVFRTDITSAVKPGESNLIRVEVDNFASKIGFYCDARLIAVSPVRIGLDKGEVSGVCVNQTNITHDRADLAVDVLFENVSGADATIECVLELFEPGGAGVAGASLRLTLAETTRRTIALSLDNPRLSEAPDNSYHYSLSVRLLRNGVEADRRDILVEFPVS